MPHKTVHTNYLEPGSVNIEASVRCLFLFQTLKLLTRVIAVAWVISKGILESMPQRL